LVDFFLKKRYKMPSVGPMNGGMKTTNTSGFYLLQQTVALGNFYAYQAPSGSGGSFNPVASSNLVAFTAVTPAFTLPTVGAGGNLNNLLLAGKMVRDMGASVVASGSTFRKVQLMVSSGTVTAGGPAVTGVQGGYNGYLTGYVQVANENNTLATDATIASLTRIY
jgi:hypothetical protein